MAAMALRANEVAAGYKRAAYLHGPSGVGKTHTMTDALMLIKMRGTDPIECHPGRYQDMLKGFQAAYEADTAIVFEEADVIWRSEKMLNILKIATCPLRSPSQRLYDGIPVTAPIFVTTNVDLEDETLWFPRLKVHILAVLRRCTPRGVSNDRRSLAEYTQGLAVYHGLINHVETEIWGVRHTTTRPIADRAHALKWFTEQQNNLVSVSPASLKQVAAAFEYSDPFERGLELDALLVPDENRRGTVPDYEDWTSVIKNS
jgi:hypothetical protein